MFGSRARLKPFSGHDRSRSHLIFPERRILDSSKLKEFEDDNFKFDKKNGGKFSERVENTVGKGRAISPFPTGFSKDLYCRHVKTRAYFGNG